ncbi:DUF2730 family protein [Varunaivibrio sulfuroxidans]|uniref:Uncharacterized protein DUF2730 n=1 Tax=Varunaivibrio sulfuroxidans TaxID=1773489 RepID=A0A4R3JAC7_9PROT|nr:DUF2730 family protein [Varunaivibrio sulfuroxidans]TCS62572.1 uncharacterized protein DUF2730 [Varunaivibrio sulfuroxidans]WES30759.1 DUF2730 family protein [Varunaivibrio sulfuroxidans]
MDFVAAKFWLDTLVLAGMVVNALYTWAMSRHRANRSEIEAVKNDHLALIQDLTQRALVMEARIDALPGARDFHGALQQMTKMDGEIGILNERLAGFKESLERVERPLNLLVEAQMKGAKI